MHIHANIVSKVNVIPFDSCVWAHLKPPTNPYPSKKVTGGILGWSRGQVAVPGKIRRHVRFSRHLCPFVRIYHDLLGLRGAIRTLGMRALYQPVPIPITILSIVTIVGMVTIVTMIGIVAMATMATIHSVIGRGAPCRRGSRSPCCPGAPGAGGPQDRRHPAVRAAEPRTGPMGTSRSTPVPDGPSGGLPAP